MVSLDILQCWKHKSGASMGTSYLNISMQNEGLGQKVAKISCFRKFGGFIQNVSIFTGKINFFWSAATCCSCLVRIKKPKKPRISILKGLVLICHRLLIFLGNTDALGLTLKAYRGEILVLFQFLTLKFENLQI